MPVHHRVITTCLGVGMLSSLAVSQAQTVSPPRSTYDVDTQLAHTRYQEDQKVCKEVPDASARLQCYRDAKAEHDRAIAAAKARRDAGGAVASSHAGIPSSCPDCARVVSISQVEREGEPSALGTIAGGIAGAWLGRQIGGGTGQDLATVAGAAGGAYAGRQIEKKVSTHTAWIVSVQFADGSRGEHEYAQDPGLRVGDLVRKTDHGFMRPGP